MEDKKNSINPTLLEGLDGSLYGEILSVTNEEIQKKLEFFTGEADKQDGEKELGKLLPIEVAFMIVTERCDSEVAAIVQKVQHKKTVVEFDEKTSRIISMLKLKAEVCDNFLDANIQGRLNPKLDLMGTISVRSGGMVVFTPIPTEMINAIIQNSMRIPVKTDNKDIN